LAAKPTAPTGVYRLAPDGALELVANDFALPNSLKACCSSRSLAPDPAAAGVHHIAYTYAGLGRKAMKSLRKATRACSTVA
jgi:hypothetical protein